MKIEVKELAKLEKEAAKIGEQVFKQAKFIDMAEKSSPVAKKTLAPLKKAVALAVKQGKAAQKAIATAKKSNGMDAKANKDLKIQVSKAVKATHSAKKLLGHEVSHVVQQGAPKAKPRDMEKSFAEKLKFWQTLEKRRNRASLTARRELGFCAATMFAIGLL